MRVAGYSGTPLAKKLGFKENSRGLVLAAPTGFAATLDGLPSGVTLSSRLSTKGPVDVAVVFCVTQSHLRERFVAAKAKLAPSGGLWVAWPKKSSGVETELTENAIRDFGLEQGLVDNKVCAVDETWSGLRFVMRLKDRP